MQFTAEDIIPDKYWTPSSFRKVLKIIANYQALNNEQLDAAGIFNTWAMSVDFDIGNADIRAFPLTLMGPPQDFQSELLEELVDDAGPQPQPSKLKLPSPAPRPKPKQPGKLKLPSPAPRPKPK